MGLTGPRSFRFVWTNGGVSQNRLTDKKVGVAGSFPTRLPPNQYRSTNLIIYFSVDFKSLQRYGKQYRWPRPRRCPRCGSRRLWGHGYVDRFFDGQPEALPIKRWRCPECGGVHTMRPGKHWRGFWALWPLIVRSLAAKEAGLKWLTMVSRQRQQYWWRGYLRQSRISGASVGLWELLRSGRILATHSLMYREIRPLLEETHPIFAVTPPARGP